jgi:hypothetical protein
MSKTYLKSDHFNGGGSRRNLFWLNDEQWKRIESHLPADVRGVERVDDRRVISGIVHVLRAAVTDAKYGPPTNDL